jgi:hypothetical protein
MRKVKDDPMKVLAEHLPKYRFDIDHAPPWFEDVRSVVPEAKPSPDSEFEKVTFRHRFGIFVSVLLVAVVIVTCVVFGILIHRASA